MWLSHQLSFTYTCLLTRIPKYRVILEFHPRDKICPHLRPVTLDLMTLQLYHYSTWSRTYARSTWAWYNTVCKSMLSRYQTVCGGWGERGVACVQRDTIPEWVIFSSKLRASNSDTQNTRNCANKVGHLLISYALRTVHMHYVPIIECTPFGCVVCRNYDIVCITG